MLTYDDLVNDMATGCKPESAFKIGVEHEQFLEFRTMPIPYDGAPGVKQVLERFAEDYGWTRKIVNGHLIALSRNGDNITLEPGGQIEISGAPLGSLQQVTTQANQYYTELNAIAAELGLDVLARGFHPRWKAADIPWMPKERYDIMGPYMAARSKHGVDMMIRTCGAQINLDFSSEADMVQKFRVALGLQPAVTAMMANSNMVEGQVSPYQSYRSFIWTETDPDRCGVPPFVFEDGMGFARYVDYALDVPMYFIMRGGHHVNVAGQSFRDFMKGQLPGHQGDFPSLSDWHDHLTTLFPEVRLKSYLELRGPDSTAPDMVFAMAAFWTGIFYNKDALDQAWDLIRDWPAALHVQIRNEVPRDGLETRLPNRQHVRNLAIEALEIAELGLRHYEPGAIAQLEPFKKRLAQF